MRVLLSRLLVGLGRLRSNSRGVAAVEFALVLPALMVMYVGAAYTSTTVTLNKKMQTAAYDLMDMVPYPRNVCTYRTFVTTSFSTGFQRSIVGEMISPFPVTDTNPSVQYVESAPDSQQLISVIAKLRYTPQTGPFKLFNTMTGSLGNAAVMKNGVITADSPVVTVKANTTCPSQVSDNINIYQNGVLVNNKTLAFEKMAGQSFNVAYTVTGGVPLLGTANPYRISSGTNLPPGVNFYSNGAAPYYQGLTQETTPGAPVTTYAADMNVADYTSYLWSQPDKTAKTTIQFLVYHQLVLAVDTSQQIIQMGSGSTPWTSKTPQTTGGKPTYSYTVTNLPPGIGYDPATGITSGYATKPGTWQVTTTVRDQMGNVATSQPVTYVVKPVPLVINGPAAFSAVGRQGVNYQWTASGGYGNISVKICADPNLGRMPNNFVCSLPVAPNQITGTITGQANELGTGKITIQVGDEAGQIATLYPTWSVSAPALYAYTDSPQAITATYGQYVALNMHTYGGWGNSYVAQVDNICCGLSVVDIGPTGSETDHVFQVRGTVSYITAPVTVVVTFRDSVGNIAKTSFTLSVPNQAMNAWSDANIVQTAGWCGNMPMFHSSGGNGARRVVGVSGQPPGFGAVGDANNYYFTGCSSPGSGTITWVVQDAIGQQAVAYQYWQFNTPALVAWNDGSAIGTAGVAYTYPYFHSAGGWGARYAASITGNPPGPYGNGDGNNWWLYGATAPGAGYSTLTFADGVGQRASSAQYWQMSAAPLGCWNDGSMVGTAGVWYQYPMFRSNGGYGNHYAISIGGNPNGPTGNGDGWNWWLTGPARPGSGTSALTFGDDAGQRCTAYQYWQMTPAPLYAWNDGSAVNNAGPFYNFPAFHSGGGYGNHYAISVWGQPGWTYGNGDGWTWWLAGTSQPGSGVATLVFSDDAGQQASAQQYWSFSPPPINFYINQQPYIYYYDGDNNYALVLYFRYDGGWGGANMVNWAQSLNYGYPVMNFNIGQMATGQGFLSFTATRYTFWNDQIYVQVCDAVGQCPVFTFQLNCNSALCAAG
jgi:hypothetical protein